MITDKINISISENTVTVNGVRYEIDLSANINTEYDYLSWGSSESFAQKFPGIRVITFKGTEKEYKDHIKPFADLWMTEKARLEEEANRPPTPDEQLAMFTYAIQAHLDNFARTRNYDGILSAATYATSTVPKFRAEGQCAVEARDATWAKGYEIMGAVMAGQRAMPTLEDVVAELPVLEWPEA